MICKTILLFFILIVSTQAQAAITVVNKLAAADNTNSLVYTTASVAFSNNKLYLLAVAGRNTGGIQAEPTVTGGGLTWVRVESDIFDTIASPQRGVVIYRAMVSSGATTGALTITWTGGNLSSCDWVLDELDGVDLSGTNGSGAVRQATSNAIDSGTSITTTLGAFGDPESTTWAAFGLSMQGANGVVTPGSGFTISGAAQSGSESHSIAAEYKTPNAGDTSVDGTFASGAVALVAVEVRAYGTAPAYVAYPNVTNKTAGSSDTNALVYTTASVSFSNDKLYLVAVAGRNTTGFPSSPTVTGGGITWVEVTSRTFETVATPDRGIVVFRGLVSSGATTGALTISWAGGNMSSCDWVIDEFSGADQSGTNGSGAVIQSATSAVDSAGSLTVNLSAFGDSRNATYGAFGLSTQNTVSAGSGFTAGGGSAGASESHGIGTETRIPNGGDTSVDAFFGTAAAGAIALEIKAAPPPKTFFRRRISR
ncbi:MAG: hypothetical protein ABL958_12955 [Bdellovibrionia bacterium]